ncbi:MAG: hypothetical protein RLZ10_1127, partial [Bacteroidota bacterium]
MMSRLLILILAVVGLYSDFYSQVLELGPITQNRQIINTSVQLKNGNSTFDSTFVFISDTIDLPIFDDFSSNKFQTYQGDLNNPSITSSLFYSLTDPISLLPLNNNKVFTNQVTFKRVFDLTANNYLDSLFEPEIVRVGDLTNYPPQYSEVGLYPPYFVFDTINDPGNEIDTIWINNPPFFQDSARIFFQNVVDPNLIWQDSYAYHNYRFAKDPRSIGVVTFDGLDDTGYPYQIGTSVTNYADKLTSKPIDLEPYNASDSIYFSFLYQPEGLGDIPEDGDSLILEFYSPEIQNWNRIWGITGDTVCPFRAVHILISNPIYFQKGFQFRFRNYGSLAG